MSKVIKLGCITSLLFGCLFFNGCINYTGSIVQKPTVGKSLMDLQTAKKTNAISEDEYNKKKAEILTDK